ncbi:hypothetical protein F7725_009080 [Dissostichus mawsoni]|uniref:Uncharacterized protein n=1 Tax=Dissostichus mawsoni TaxID=36200 RepID=A0A7J5Z7U4_DISMA|nr:hypothetical protein F7725_009080 [Dissostichus mawsoni]
MSSREMLEAAGRALALPPRTVLAGDARVLLLCTSAAPPSAGARVLGAGTPPSGGSRLAFGLPARRRVWFGNGVELLFDGAQVGHQGVQVHCVALLSKPGSKHFVQVLVLLIAVLLGPMVQLVVRNLIHLHTSDK